MKVKLFFLIIALFSTSCLAGKDETGEAEQPAAALAPASPTHSFVAFQAGPPTPEQMQENIKRAIAP